MHERPVRRLSFHASDPNLAEALSTREWLLANGLGGYACGSLAGIPTRRFHALLVAALPPPLGRAIMLNRLTETIRSPTFARRVLGGDDDDQGLHLHEGSTLLEFRLEAGLPVWRYQVAGYVVERRVLLVHGQNTVHATYTLLSGAGTVRIDVRPWVDFRRHDDSVSGARGPYRLIAEGPHLELHGDPAFPPLRLTAHGLDPVFTLRGEEARLRYRAEADRGYDHEGTLQSPGTFRASLAPGRPFTLIASCEPWAVIDALGPAQACEAELARRERLLARADARARRGVPAELVLAADPFVIAPVARGARALVAGYPWSLDAGRDAMISLEGLTLLAGRHDDAREVLRTFAREVRDGLIPNLVPEDRGEGVYHTADASLWFFHALSRYLAASGDRALLAELAPSLRAIADAHLVGTRYGIGVDPADGLLRQGEAGYQLTWMDAKLADRVVTPRRGKAVEINALFYNALCLLATWQEELGEPARGEPYARAAARARAAFNARFWCAHAGHLHDVVDGEHGDDAAPRPNQLLAISLDHPILDRARWTDVLDACRRLLLTPVGLRSLGCAHPEYEPRYFGDLRARDAAYHQGTVWGWLIGPFADAWRKVRPDDLTGLRRVIDGFTPHLSEACIGTVSEIFDGDAPFTARGSVAQAWSVAELLRCHLMLDDG
ncbi:MAG: amylo-alpha-1,6-glucosidase [Polyangiales bacterium]